MLMVSYEFYKGSYFGSLIPEKAFSGMALRAKEALERLQRQYRVSGGEDSLKMAICAMAETLYTHSKRRTGLTAASVGEVSVRYEDGVTACRSLQRELYDKACIYLDIYRGVSR